jgi:hypothetical protein
MCGLGPVDEIDERDEPNDNRRNSVTIKACWIKLYCQPLKPSRLSRSSSTPPRVSRERANTVVT